MPYTIDEIRTKAMPIAIRYGVDALSLFGSYARGGADEKSDLDFLILKGSMKEAIKDEKFLEEIDRDEVKLYERQKIRTGCAAQMASLLPCR